MFPRERLMNFSPKMFTMTASYVEKIKMLKILLLIKGERTHKAESSFKGSNMNTKC